MYSKSSPRSSRTYIVNSKTYEIQFYLVEILKLQVGDMRDELLKADDMNVVVVDWAGGSLPLYTQATANTRLVGLELGYFINYLIVSKFSLYLLLNYSYKLL